MNWKEVKELQKHGVEIGSHSYYHPYLTSYKEKKDPEKWLKTQLVDSKDFLEKKLDSPIKYFAIPFGVYDQYVYEKMKISGYSLILNVNNKPNSRNSDPYDLNRHIIYSSDTGSNFLRKIGLSPGKNQTGFAQRPSMI